MKSKNINIKNGEWITENKIFIKETFSQIVHFTTTDNWEQIQKDKYIKPAKLTQEEYEEIRIAPFFKFIGAFSVFNFNKTYVECDVEYFNKYINFNEKDLSKYERKLLKNIENATDIQKKALLWHKRYIDIAQHCWTNILSSDICLILDKNILPCLLSWKEKYRLGDKYNRLVIPCLEMGHVGNMPIDIITKVIKINTKLNDSN